VGFDALGRLDYFNDQLRNLTLDYQSYDYLSRLRTIAGSYPQSYDYDNADNLTAINDLKLSYTDPAHPHRLTAVGEGTGFGYDANGNVISRTLGSGTVIRYTYDAKNRYVFYSAAFFSTIWLKTSLIFETVLLARGSLLSGRNTGALLSR